MLGRLAWRLASGVPLTLSASDLAGLLAEPERLRVVAALALGSSTATSVGETAGLDARAVATALARLEAGGLVERGADGTLVLLESAFRQAARAAAASAPAEPDPGEGHDAETAKVLRAFVRDGRLTALPTAESKKRILLDVICQDVEPGRRYTEPEVNLVLHRWHDDVASLRRWLVDLGYLDRDAGEYWRSGGPLARADRSSAAGSSTSATSTATPASTGAAEDRSARASGP